MNGLHGHTPQINWLSSDLVTASKDFYSHVHFMFQGHLKGKSEAEKMAYLKIWVGQRSREVHSKWNFSNDERKLSDANKSKFEEYLMPKTKTVFNRLKYQCRVQSETDTSDEFITNLKVLPTDCD